MGIGLLIGSLPVRTICQLTTGHLTTLQLTSVLLTTIWLTSAHLTTNQLTLAPSSPQNPGRGSMRIADLSAPLVFHRLLVLRPAQCENAAPFRRIFSLARSTKLSQTIEIRKTLQSTNYIRNLFGLLARHCELRCAQRSNQTTVGR